MEVLQVDNLLYNMDTDFVKDLSIDELDAYEICMAIEDEFDIGCCWYCDWPEIKTVGDLYNLVISRLN